MIDWRCEFCEVRIISLLRKEVEHRCYRVMQTFIVTKAGAVKK